MYCTDRFLNKSRFFRVMAPKGKSIAKKKWVQIVAPIEFNNRIIGETYTNDPEVSLGKVATVSLSTITGDPQKQSIEAKFKLSKYSDGKIHTEFVRYKIVPSNLKK